ncbi:hypothetical protein CRENBAI_002332 [Crenichthys baileyi]|uniref:Uncharacterized protein n=1 Tax=Crenichthys baileyi TaxID=28760 RepID=A0AAV9R7G1_9TELE
MTASGRTWGTRGGAQRHGAVTPGTQDSGGETAGTFGENVEFCGGAAKAQQAERWRGKWRREQELSSWNRRFLPGPFVVRPRWCGESEDQEKNPSSPRASLGGCQLSPTSSKGSRER